MKCLFFPTGVGRRRSIPIAGNTHPPRRCGGLTQKKILRCAHLGKTIEFPPQEDRQTGVFLEMTDLIWISTDLLRALQK